MAAWRGPRSWRSEALARAQEAVIARWISDFGALGDAEGFRRVGLSIAILDRAEAVVQQLLAIAEIEARSTVSEISADPDVVRTLVIRWEELVRDYYQEAHYWEDRHAAASGLDLGEYPITRRRYVRVGTGPAARESTHD